MADTKITDLTELTGVAATDLMVVVDDPGGSPVTKKATLANAFAAFVGYGDLYVTGGSATQALTADTPAKLALFTADGPSSNSTPAHAADSITVGVSGVWGISFQASMTASVNNTVLTFALALGGVAQAIKCQRKIGTGADVGSCSFTGHLSLTAADVLTILVTGSMSGNLILTEAQLSVRYLGA